MAPMKYFILLVLAGVLSSLSSSANDCTLAVGFSNLMRKAAKRDPSIQKAAAERGYKLKIKRPAFVLSLDQECIEWNPYFYYNKEHKSGTCVEYQYTGKGLVIHEQSGFRFPLYNIQSARERVVISPANQVVLDNMKTAKNIEEYREIQSHYDASLDVRYEKRSHIQDAIMRMPTCEEMYHTHPEKLKIVY